MKNGRFTRAVVSAVRAWLSALCVILALLLVLLAPLGEALAQDCGDTLVPDGTAGSCPANGGGTGGSPLDPTAPNDAGSAGADPLAPPATVGNPISLFTGNKREVETDFALPGASLAFRRFYNSANEAWRSGIGQGWSHTYAVSLFATPDGARELLQSDGRRLHFAPAGTDDEGRALFRTRSAFEGRLVATGENAHRWELPDGRHLTFTGSYLVEIDWPDQRRLTLYYRQQRLASVTDETGRVLRLAYWPGVAGADRALGDYQAQDHGPASGQLASLTLPDGELIEYEYDDRSNLTRAAYPDGTHREYHYEDETYPSHLTGLTDRTGVRFATWDYDGQGRAISSEHAGGVERVTIDYPEPRAIEAGQTVGTTVTNSLGQPSLYTWEQPVGGSPRLLEATGAGCTSCPPTGMRWAYDARGRLAEATVTGEDPVVGADTTQYAYDEEGRLAAIQRVAPDGTVTPVERREYAGVDDLEPDRIVRPSVNPNGERVTTFERDGRSRVTAVTERGYAPFVALPTESGLSEYVALTRTTRFEYSDDRLIGIDGPLDGVDDITRLSWDASSRLERVSPPEGPSLHVEGHDANGLVTRIRLGTRSPHELRYDTAGNLVSISNPAGTRTFEWDAEGRLTNHTDTDGHRIVARHDDAGRLARVEDDFGRVTELFRDSDGRDTGRDTFGIDGQLVSAIALIIDPDGRVSRRDERLAHPDTGELLERSQTLEYGSDGQLTAVADAESGRRIEYGVDLLERLATVSRPDGSVQTRHYDRIDQPAGLTDARGNRTVVRRDDFGDIVATVSPDTGIERLERDAAGRVIRRVREDSGVTEYERDAAGRMVERRGADGSTAHWRHDPRTGQLVEAWVGEVRERFGHDVEGALIEHVREIDGHRFTTRYERDAGGRILSKTLPDGQVLRYDYRIGPGGAVGALRTVSRSTYFGLGREIVVDEIDQEYRDGDGGWTAHNGVRTSLSFAPDGTLRSLDAPGLLAIDLSHDGVGRISAMNTDGQRTSYLYRDGRLAGALSARERYGYEYDAAGNRTAARGQVGGSTTFDTRYRTAVDVSGEGAGNRLVERVDALAGTVERRDHDAGGSLLRSGDLEYAYDTERRPVRLTRGGEIVATYAYNATGERVSKTVRKADGAQRVTYFLYDEAHLSGEADARGELLAQYVYLDEHRPVARLEGEAIYAIHTDHLGTPRRMSDAAGELVWSADYAPFGQARVTLERRSLPLRLPGQYADEETGTHYNYFRDYDPEAGRYLTSDPIGLAGGPNTYAYVDNLPTMNSDVLGLRGTARRYTQVTTQYAIANLNVQQLTRQIQLYNRDFQYARITAGNRPFDRDDVESLVITLQGYQLTEEIRGLDADFRYGEARTVADVTGLENRLDALTYIGHIRATQDPDFLYDRASYTDADLDRLYHLATTGESQCTALYEADFERFVDVRQLDALLQGDSLNAYLSPEGVWFPSEEAYRYARSAYDDMGGQSATGSSFDEWVAAGMPDAVDSPSMLVAQQQWSRERQRALLRDALNSAGTGKIAHHVIPLEALTRFPDLMKRAAEGGFDINGANNGVLLDRVDHIGGHPQYNDAVMEALAQLDPDASAAIIARRIQQAADTLQRAIADGTYGPWG